MSSNGQRAKRSAKRRERKREQRATAATVGGTHAAIDPPRRKMSETLGEFAQPLLLRLPVATADNWREELAVAVLVWDGVLAGYAPSRIIEQVAALCGRGDALTIVPALIERKKTMFADDTRHILGFDTYERGDRVHIVALSAR